MKTWESRDLGDVDEFLGIKIERSKSTIKLNQRTYLLKVLDRFGMINCRPAPTPLPSGYKPVPNTGTVDQEVRKRYQQVIGSLLYLSLGTRPDVTYAVSKMSQFMANPTKDHLAKAIYICRYLAGTSDYTLQYRGDSDENIIAYTDSDWGTDASKRSQTGYLINLAGGAICWKSRLPQKPNTSLLVTQPTNVPGLQICLWN